MGARNISLAGPAATLFLIAPLGPVQAQEAYPYDMDPAEFVDEMLTEREVLTMYLIDPCPTPGSWADQVLDEVFVRDLTPAWYHRMGVVFRIGIEQCDYERFREWFFIQIPRAARGGGADIEFLTTGLENDHSESTTRFLLEFIADDSYPLGARELAGSALMIERPPEERLALLEEMARRGEILANVAGSEVGRLPVEAPEAYKFSVARMLRESPNAAGLLNLVPSVVRLSVRTEAETGRRTAADEALADALEEVTRNGSRVRDPETLRRYRQQYTQLRPGGEG